MSSQRLDIANGLMKLFQGITNPSTSQPVFQFVKLGAMFDPSAYTSFAEVVDPQGKTGHAGSGGNQIGWRIEDTISFKVSAGWPYEPDSTAAMTAMLTAQDIVLPLLTSHPLIPAPNNPAQPIASVYSLLESQNQTDSSQPVRFPNGHVYLLWTVWLQVKQQYNVTLQVP